MFIMQNYHRQKHNWFSSGTIIKLLSHLCQFHLTLFVKIIPRKGLNSRKVTTSLRLLKQEVNEFWKHVLAETSAFCSTANTEDEIRKFVCCTRWRWRRNMFRFLKLKKRRFISESKIENMSSINFDRNECSRTLL